MQTLYCFKLDELTGMISRTAIEKYKEYHPSVYFPNKVRYDFSIGYNSFSVNGENIDKFVNWKVYSFADDIEKAKKIMSEDLKDRLVKAEKDVKRFSSVIKKLGD